MGRIKNILRNIREFFWDEFGPTMFGVMAMILPVFIAFVFFMAWAWDHDEKACAAKGGHLTSKTSGGMGFDTKGKPVYTTTTVTFCISKDGRIIEDY